MKYIKKVSTVKIDKTTGSVVDTTNITDKVTNAYSARVVEELIKNNTPEIDIPEVPTKTSQLTNDSGFITGLKISNYSITYHTILGSTNITPNGSKTGTVNVTNPGYYPIGIVGWDSSGTGFYMSAASLGAASIYYNASNPHPNTITCYLTIRILWAK